MPVESVKATEGREDQEKGRNLMFGLYNAIRTGSVNSRKKRGFSTEGICDAKMISGWKMEMMAMKIFKQNLLDTGDAVELAKKMIADHQSQTQNISDEKDEENRKAMEKEIQNLEKKIDALLDLLLEDTIDKSQYQNKKMMIQQQIQKLKSNFTGILEEMQSIKIYQKNLLKWHP